MQIVNCFFSKLTLYCCMVKYSAWSCMILPFFSLDSFRAPKQNKGEKRYLIAQ